MMHSLSQYKNAQIYLINIKPRYRGTGTYGPVPVWIYKKNRSHSQIFDEGSIIASFSWPAFLVPEQDQLHPARKFKWNNNNNKDFSFPIQFWIQMFSWIL